MTKSPSIPGSYPRYPYPRYPYPAYPAPAYPYPAPRRSSGPCPLPRG